jgi:hypothetical protein
MRCVIGSRPYERPPIAFSALQLATIYSSLHRHFAQSHTHRDWKTTHTYVRTAATLLANVISPSLENGLAVEYVSLTPDPSEIAALAVDAPNNNNR